MSKRTKKNSRSNPQPEAQADAAVDNTVETANDDAVTAEMVEPVLDEDVLAMIAAETADAPAMTTDAEPEITAEDVEEPTEEEVLAAIDASGTPAKKSGSKRAPKTPAAPMREFTAVAAIDEATLKSNLDGCNAKKVKEKAENLIATITHGKKLSRYTAVAVSELIANGRISGKSMTDRFQAEGLSVGTARAQAQQMTALFKLVGAVQPDAANPRELVVQDNQLVQELAAAAA
jgi:hypothetical protein